MKIEDNEIYIREFDNTWSIAIISMDIIIDNHKDSNSIYLKHKNKTIPISHDNFKSIKDIIKLHILTHRKIKKDILIKKLIGDSL